MEIRLPNGETPNFMGEILLCEDNEINQHFIKAHLNRLGFDVVIAGDGREGVDIVSGRVKSGEKPFDLIFMDIQMPVMDGLEAAGIISGMNVKTPMVALTANVMQDDKDIYAAHGMPVSLCKPFALEELLSCLYEYFTPVSHKKISAGERSAEDEKQRKKLFSSFVRRNQTTYEDICSALAAGDVKLAHRLSHTLRGLAGLMGKSKLQESSRVVENALSSGNAEKLRKEDLEAVGLELKSVLGELAPFMKDNQEEAASSVLDKDAARKLLDELEPLLKSDSAKSRDYADSLRAVAGAGELITLIEDYEFEAALDAMAKLRETIG